MTPEELRAIREEMGHANMSTAEQKSATRRRKTKPVGDGLRHGACADHGALMDASRQPSCSLARSTISPNARTAGSRLSACMIE
jgi:hypothetical protein